MKIIIYRGTLIEGIKQAEVCETVVLGIYSAYKQERKYDFEMHERVLNHIKQYEIMIDDSFDFDNSQFMAWVRQNKINI